MYIISSKRAKELFPPEFVNDSYFLKVFENGKPEKEYIRLVNTGTLEINGFIMGSTKMKRFTYKFRNGGWYMSYAPSKKMLKEKILLTYGKDALTKVCEMNGPKWEEIEND